LRRALLKNVNFSLNGFTWYGLWIKYDNDKDQMYCSICRDPNLKKFHFKIHYFVPFVPKYKIENIFMSLFCPFWS
jgi:hypothetical protein